MHGRRKLDKQPPGRLLARQDIQETEKEGTAWNQMIKEAYASSEDSSSSDDDDDDDDEEEQQQPQTKKKRQQSKEEAAGELTEAVVSDGTVQAQGPRGQQPQGERELGRTTSRWLLACFRTLCCLLGPWGRHTSSCNGQ